jgi:hypothetical protein
MCWCDYCYHKNVVSSGKSSEDSSVAKIVVFDGFDSGLILSSNGLNESYVEYAQKTRNQ